MIRIGQPKVPRPNPVVTWESLTGAPASPSHHETDTSLYVAPRGQCRLNGCEGAATVTATPTILLCAEHAAWYHEVWRTRKTLGVRWRLKARR